MPQRILVIEDDAAIRRGIVDALRSEGFETIEAGRAEAGQSLALESECDLVLLDLVLPGGDGLDILQVIRGARPTLPVIILTARGEEADRVQGLKRGADDYVVKPFSVSELLARVQAVLRRSPARPEDITAITFRGGAADLVKRRVHFSNGDAVELSQREAELLIYLARHHRRVITRQEILQHVWHLDPAGLDTRTIDMHVARLREKLRDDPANPRVLLTVRGKGYTLTLEEPRA
jgi:two-component system alkaline phosphatase synthesis response regulator PhoP